MTTTSSTRRAIAALGLGAITAAGSIAPAAAAPGPKPPRLLVTGGETWFTHDSGYPVVLGAADVYVGKARDPEVGRLAANIHPDGRTMPGAGECEQAIAFLFVLQDDEYALTLTSAGEVCGYEPQVPESVVTHVFTGPATVEQSDHRNLVGREGFMEIRLGLDGQAHAFATAG